MGLGTQGRIALPVEQKDGRIGCRCTYICICGNRTRKSSWERFISSVYCKHNLLLATQVEEMGTTTINNSRNVHWGQKAGQDLDTLHLTEVSSQPSKVF